MGAARGDRLSTGRYRRRVLGWGAAALLVTLFVGSAVTLARVEDDLRLQVGSALDASGFGAVTVSFSGQDGTLVCDEPLDDPDAALDIGTAVNGVRTLELDASCVAAPEEVAAEPDETAPPPTATTSIPATTPDTTTPDTTSTTTPPDPATVLDILVDDPQFSALENALESVDLGELLGGPGPITMFAPTDEAFATLGPNFNATLASNPDALSMVLLHHITAMDLPSDQLADGPLMMVDGTEVEVDTSSGVRVNSGDVTATVIDPDLIAVNGVVHVIDEVLLPEGLDGGVVAEVFTFVGRYEDGRVVLSGRVASDNQRFVLVTAARRSLASPNVVDQLVVDAETPISDAEVDALAEFVSAIPRDLVVGEVVVSQDGIFVSGVVVDVDARQEIELAAERLGASTGLTERPMATDIGIAALEERLNDEVAAEPVRFEQASADLVAESAVLDRLAALAKSLDGLVITVEGHTDSDGADDVNLALSEARAAAVVAALAERGVPPADLVAVGLGSLEPVLVDDVEDKTASRRVEFSVESE